MKTTDNVSDELREVEKEIDNYYKSNPLLKLPFATAAWSLLASGENWRRKQTQVDNGMQHHTIIADDLVMVSDTMTVLKPLFDRMFSLPSEWQFSRYSLGDFREVFEAISAIAYIRSMVQTMAAAKGCVDMGYADSIYVPTHGELRARVARYSRVSDTTVRSIFDDLTYGNRNISHPDPAL